MRVWDLGVRGSWFTGFRVEGLGLGFRGLGIWGSGFYSLGLRVCGLGLDIGVW